ncbi:hypothetical protein GRI40_08355 [Altererythrobacter aerius]|uniref:Nitrogen fixation protein FixH n=1 Tax=Tsuneonella aeria TaxID=1837929 RepID=A0A6I4TF51_9SPHN|nr:FixH family protein [Tsuneonella aeria]MXO75226.1 hypothetical protein [Tsuneonella aeria]
MNRPFTGRHMAAVLVTGFGVVIAVNMLMATLASQTFGGIVVKNSYVASQQFNGWLAEAKRQESLGWKVVAERRADGRVALTLSGAPADAAIEGLAWHPLGREADVALTFSPDGPNRFLSAESLSDGRWTLRLTIRAGGDLFRSESPIG